MDNFAGLNTVNKRKLAIQTATKEQAVAFCQQYGLIASVILLFTQNVID